MRSFVSHILGLTAGLSALAQPISQQWSSEDTIWRQPNFGLPDPLDGVNMNSIYDQQYQRASKGWFGSASKSLPPIVLSPSENETTISPGEIPDYVLQFAPLVHLYSEEKYLPYDVNEYVSHLYLTYANGTNLTTDSDLPLNLSHLCNFNKYTHEEVYMTSLDDFTTDPDWITGKKNKPNYENGLIKDAPAVLIVVDKGNGWLDSYWFYFYSFNLGPFVMGHGPYGNHVGDWEHSLVRFYQGKPVTLWMSAHGGGNGYNFDAVEKYGDFDEGKRHRNHNHKHNATTQKRPIIFSARGTHANYASVGQHAHDLPYSILSDFTDRGSLWDPAMNYLGYTWDGVRLTPALNKTSLKNNITLEQYKHNTREQEYGPWLLWWGHWGDKKLNPSDERQVWSPWEYKYIDGPKGPLNKNLLRDKVCQRAKWWNFWNGCTVRRYLDMGSGIESEGINTCIVISNKIHNPILRQLVVWITYGGWTCFIIDNIWA